MVALLYTALFIYPSLFIYTWVSVESISAPITITIIAREMRASIFISTLVGVFCVAEQSPIGSNATEVNELFLELAELPTCAVSINYQRESCTLRTSMA